MSDISDLVGMIKNNLIVENIPDRTAFDYRLAMQRKIKPNAYRGSDIKRLRRMVIC